MMRIVLFLATNLAVMLLASVTLSLLGVRGFLAANGGLDFTSLLIYCGVFGMAGSLVSLFLSKTMAKFGTGAQVITEPQNANERWLLSTVEDLAKQAGIGMPEVAIFNSPQPNAFATGWNRNASLVAVSTGLLQSMRQEEVKAVLGHEIGHVANGDMVTLALLQGVVNTFVMFGARVIGYFVDRALSRGDDNRGVGIGFYVTTMVAELVLGILASMIVMWFSRYREFRADAAGARLAGRENMIGALNRLRLGSEMPSALPQAMAAFGIAPSAQSGFRALFSSHPPLAVRIAALQQRTVG